MSWELSLGDGAGWAWALCALLASVALPSCAALLERAGPIRLRAWAEEADGRLLALFDRPARFEAFRFLLSSLARVTLLLLLVALYAATPVPRGGAEAAVALVASAAVAGVVELVNRFLLARSAETFLRRFTGLYRVIALLVWPLLVALSVLPPFRAGRRPEAVADEASEEEIEAFIDVGTKEGILEPGQADLVRGIVDFGETSVRSVMTPRIDVIGLPEEATTTEAARLFAESKHTRLPVFAESADQIVGVLHVLDVVAASIEGATAAGRTTVKELAKLPLVVPETKPLNELLREFQAGGQQMAIVVNEHGSTAGLVTIEDLLEEIVGEIADEYDSEGGVDREQLPGGVWRLSGGEHVEALADLFDVSLEDPPYETLGGLVMSVLGTVPRVGDSVASLGLRFTVERVDGRRIDAVRVERVPPAAEPAAGGAA